VNYGERETGSWDQEINKEWPGGGVMFPIRSGGNDGGKRREINFSRRVGEGPSARIQVKGILLGKGKSRGSELKRSF